MQTIYRFLKTNKQTQKFGENRACIKVSGGVPIWPLVVKSKRGEFCKAGYKGFYRWYLGLKGHPGEDWKAWHGEPLYFAADLGTEWWAKSEADIGVRLDVYSVNRVKIDKLPSQAGTLARREWEENNGHMYVKFVFAHLLDILWAEEKVQVGTFTNGEPEMKPVVKLGYQIGWANNTGASSGDHTHLSLKFVTENGLTLDGDNGYNGAVDYRECFNFENTFIGNVMEVRRIANEVRASQYRLIDILKLFIAKLRS